MSEKKPRNPSLNKSLDSCLDIVGVAGRDMGLGNMVRDWWGKDSPKPQRRRTGTMRAPEVHLEVSSPPVFCDEPDCNLVGCHGGSAEALDKPSTRVTELKKFGRMAKGYSWCDVYASTGTQFPIAFHRTF